MPRRTSQRVRAVSSEGRSPVWAASVVAAAGAGGPVWGGEQGLGLGAGEERDDCLIGPLGQDGQYPGDVGGVLGVAQGCVGEQEGSRPAGSLQLRMVLPRLRSIGRGTR